MDASTMCRICGARQPVLRRILDLGRTPLANRLLSSEQLEQPEPTWPLELALCSTCSLLQLTTTVPPEMLYREYLYRSSVADTMQLHVKRLVDQLCRTRSLGPRSLVIEAASNDGYLLRHFHERGVPVLGIEPARNLARLADNAGVPTLDDFFTAKLALLLRQQGKRADVFLGLNVLAHVPDPGDFVTGVHLLLTPDGLAIFEVPYVLDLIERQAFDTIYHEHLCYFSLTALHHLFCQHGLVIQEVQRFPIHGGTLRLLVQHASAPYSTLPPQGEEGRKRVAELLRDEQRWGVQDWRSHVGFVRAVTSLRRELRFRLRDLKESGQRLAAYGAAAKGATLLNLCGLGRETIDFVVDRNPLKQGFYLPGSRVPILPPERLVQEMPDYTLLLAWNLTDEVLEQQQEYRRRGGRFIVPLPRWQVV